MRNFLFLIPSIFLLNSEASAMSPDPGSVLMPEEMKSAIARAPSYEAFKEAMRKHSLHKICTSSDFHMTDWSRFRRIISFNQLALRNITHYNYYYSLASTEGLIEIYLSSEASAMSPDPGSVLMPEEMKSAIARTPSYGAFEEEMKKHGGLHQICTSSDFHMTDWSKFQRIISFNQLALRNTTYYNYYHTIASTEGFFGIFLNQPQASTETTVTASSAPAPSASRPPGGSSPTK